MVSHCTVGTLSLTPCEKCLTSVHPVIPMDDLCLSWSVVSNHLCMISVAALPLCPFPSSFQPGAGCEAELLWLICSGSEQLKMELGGCVEFVLDLAFWKYFL